MHTPGSRTSAGFAPDKQWLVPIARTGYYAKSIVYVAIGALAIGAAVGEGGKTTGAVGALGEIAKQPFGRILVGVIALGLACYAVWRWAQFGADPENKAGGGATGKLQRAVYLVSAVIHTGLAITAGTLAVSAPSGGSSSSKAKWVADLMEQPGGRILVGGVGLVIFGVGIAEIVKAFKGEEAEKLDLARLDSKARKGVQTVTASGLAARGVVFGAIASQVVLGALRFQADKAASGSREALVLLSNQEFGWLILLVVAAGLVCYGVFCSLKGALRRFAV